MTGPTKFNLLSKEQQDKELKLNFKELSEMIAEDKCSLQNWFKEEEEKWRIRFDDLEFYLDDNNQIVWEDDSVYLDRSLNKEGFRKEAERNPILYQEIQKIRKLMSLKGVSIYPMIKKYEGEKGVRLDIVVGSTFISGEGELKKSWIEEIKKCADEINHPINLKKVEIIRVFDKEKSKEEGYFVVSIWAKEIAGEFKEIEKIINVKFEEYEKKIKEWVEMEKGIEVIRDELVKKDYYVLP